MDKRQTFIDYVQGKVVERIIFVNDAGSSGTRHPISSKTAFHVRLDVSWKWKRLKLLDWTEGKIAFQQLLIQQGGRRGLESDLVKFWPYRELMKTSTFSLRESVKNFGNNSTILNDRPENTAMLKKENGSRKPESSEEYQDA